MVNQEKPMRKLTQDAEIAIDEAGYALLMELAGIDCYDTNLRDQPAAYAALDRYRETCAHATQADAPEAGQEAKSEHQIIAAFLERSGQYVTNDATREAFRVSVLEEAADRVEHGSPPTKRAGGRVEIGEGARQAFADAIRALASKQAAAVQAVGAAEQMLKALKFHPSASHVSPDFRDLFNATLQQHFDMYVRPRAALSGSLGDGGGKG